MVEQRTFNPTVVGSIPTTPTMNIEMSWSGKIDNAKNISALLSGKDMNYGIYIVEGETGKILDWVLYLKKWAADRGLSLFSPMEAIDRAEDREKQGYGDNFLLIQIAKVEIYE